MNIGALAKASGVNAKLIRYYESIGLLPPAERTEANYRVYGPNAVHQLRFIRRARGLGFSMPEIERLLGLWQDDSRSSAQVKTLAMKHVSELEARISEMQAMADSLRKLAASCHGDDRPDCPILEDLAGHAGHVGCQKTEPDSGLQ